MAPGKHLPDEIWIAVRAGVCVALGERSAEEIVAILKQRVQLDEPLQNLGVPIQIETEFRNALRGRHTEAGKASESQGEAASVKFADVGFDQELE